MKTPSFLLLIITSTALAIDPSLAQPLTTDFQPKDNVGLKIFADENRLLVDDAGAGFYLIGSDDDTDDMDNIASFVKTNDGNMRPMDPKYATPYIPYSFTFRPDPENKNRYHFEVKVGPAPFNFTTISMPFDGRMQRFTHMRYAGGPAMEPYDKNPPTYTAPGQTEPYRIKFVRNQVDWAEMIGPDYTIRITLTKTSRPNHGVAFVHAPTLSTGVNNVEFGFGRIAKGESASASGYIDVSRTDPALFPPAAAPSPSK